MLCPKNSATIINYADSRHGLSCIDDYCNCHWLEILYANNFPFCFLWWAVLFRLRIHFLSLFIFCQWWLCCLILSCEMVCVMKVEVLRYANESKIWMPSFAETLIIDNHCLYAGWQANCGLMLQFYKGCNTAAAVPRRFCVEALLVSAWGSPWLVLLTPPHKTPLELRLLTLLYFFDKTATWPSYFLIYERWNLPNFQGSVLHHNLCLLMLAA